MGLARREFVRIVVLAGTGAVVAACGGGDSGDGGTAGGGGTGGPPDCATNGGRASGISGNHGHSLTIPVADFGDGLDHIYSIEGNADHDHEIALSAAQLATILGGGTVNVTSSIGGSPVHTHTVTAACA
jgi:hypothetical protein